MSPKAQRIKIAEACPAIIRWNDTHQTPLFVFRGELIPFDPLLDLNAMHSAEETLDANECAEYARQLSKHHPTYCVSVLEKGEELEDIAYQTWSIIHAAAEQRAEAFLRTKGIWVEDKP